MSKEQINPDFIIDLEEMGCGDLVIAFIKAMRPLEVGQILKARALDKGAAADIPAWCNMRMTKN
ncbi:MAG: hypothetical protein L0229_01850 [Blastocatellia bacterium]|nr:hypothetical protein [Blastocatellia bacterium]